jgi:lysylphosphatidylglycerol synthetase-like protein (DUF2156 family)
MNPWRRWARKIGSMLEFLNSWPVALAGSLALGVLGNLLTPTVSRLLGSVNEGRRKRAVGNMIHEFNIAAHSMQNGSLTPEIVFRCYEALRWTILWSFTIITAMIYIVAAKISRQFHQSTTVLFEVSKSAGEIIHNVLMWSFMLLVLVLTYILARTTSQATRLWTFTLAPRLRRQETLKRLRRMDPNFDERRLATVPGDTE